MISSLHQKYIDKILDTCLQIFLTICNILTIIFLPIIPLLALLKCLVYICARTFRSDLKHFMSSPSTLLAQENILVKPKLNICLLFIFDGSLNLEKLRALFQQRIMEKTKTPNTTSLMYPELKMYWTTFLNYTFWKGVENFDLKSHIRLYDYGAENKSKNKNNKNSDSLKLPVDFCFEEDLRRVMGPLLEMPWEEGQSPWEALLVPNFKRAGLPPRESDNEMGASCTAVVFRIHHALGDGYSVLKLLLRDLMLVDPQIKINHPHIKPWKQILLALVFPLKLAWDMAGCLMNAVDGDNSWHRWGTTKKLSRKVYTSFSNPIDTQIIKNVKNKYGVGYNAVLCAVAAEGCRRAMKEAGQKIPPSISCYVPFPWPGHPDGLVNHASIHLFKWVLDNKLTRKERLRKISRNMMPSKYYTAPLGIWIIIKIGNCIPNVLLKFRGLAPFTVCFTSFPGPKGEPEFNGMGVKLVDTIAALGPGTGTSGTIFCLVSSNGKQRFAVNIDQSNYPSQKLFERTGQFIEEELMALAQTEKNIDKELFILP